MAFARLFLKILFGLVAVFILIGLFLPASVTVERSLQVAKPAAEIFPHINDLRAFRRWSPWSEIDPGTRWEFTGPAQGVGASMQWRSEHPKVGNGLMRIVRSEPTQRVGMALTFDGQGGGTALFELEPRDAGTLVHWRFSSEFGWNLPGRYFGLLLDHVLGPFFESGLDSLRTQLENPE